MNPFLASLSLFSCIRRSVYIGMKSENGQKSYILPLEVKTGIFFISCADVKGHPGGQNIPVLTQAKR